MSTTTNTSYYKQYKRQTRTQLTEEKFNLGINFTSAPLTEGYQSMLVNYDQKSDGNILKPRAGLHVVKAGLGCAFDASQYMICAGKACVEEDNTYNRQIIIGKPTTAVAGTALYSGTLQALTVSENEIADTATTGSIKDITCHPLNRDDSVGYFRKPDAAQIHGMVLNNTSYIARQVGTYAYGNSYYCFRAPNTLTYTKYNAVSKKQEFNDVAVRALTPKEAVSGGYNMLAANPYIFANTAGDALQFFGILPYDAFGNLKMSPQLNETVHYKCFYQAAVADAYKFIWEWKEPTSETWNLIQVTYAAMTELPVLEASLSSPVKDILFRISAYKKMEDTTYNSTVDKIMTVGFTFNRETFGSTANIDVQSYDLSTCSGMTYWQNRLIVYGVTKNPTILFTSDINNPGYFPYPNGVDTFDEPIVYVTPFLDNLLVFTATKLILLTLTADGISWTKKTIQGNLSINDWDIHLIKVVKNMVFFKSGNYYYMVVPRATSTTGELTIAPISKNIETFLDNFQENIASIVDLMYAYNSSLTLTHYYNFLDFEDMHNVYVFAIENADSMKAVYLNVDLLYSTITRAWRVHIYESQNILIPYRQDATKKGTLMSLFHYTWNGSNGTGVQFHEFTETQASDVYIPNYLVLTGGTVTDPTELFTAVHQYKNFQLLDTGYREHYTDYNKRYRELQLKFNNTSQKALHFMTEFTIDGDARKTFYKQEYTYETDPLKENYGVITLERVPIDEQVLPGSTILAENEQDINAWTLDSSVFPENLLCKVRIPVSGKGYAPKFRLLSLTEEQYELLNITWVFRLMYSR